VKKRVVVIMLSGMLYGAHPLRAQESSASNFAPLEFLVGNCWVGKFGDGKTTDEHCFEWKYGRHFIRDHHVVRGADGAQVYEGETLYGWNPATKEIMWRYVSVEGLIMDGTVARQDDKLVFPARYPTPAGVTESKAVWTVRADGYTAVSSVRSEAGWKEQFRVEFRRKQ
jgi:hypothetical protein